MILANLKYLYPAAFLLCIAQSIQSQQVDLAITGATIIDGTGEPPQEATTIFIHEGQITAVMPDSDTLVPEKARVIDAAGKYIIPGLADMHVHFGSGGMESREATTLDRILRQFLFYGVTTVFSVGGTGGNAPSIETLRLQVNSGNTLAPHVYATGSMAIADSTHAG